MESKMSELNQLLLELDYKTNFNEHDFYLSQSNSNAFNLINRWPAWDKKILNISGEKFSGKSHLANIFRLKSKAFFVKGNKIDNSIFKSLKLHESIIIDDFEECNKEEILYSIFNLIDQDSKYLLINSLKPINEIKFKLPDLASRSKNCLYAVIENPDDELLFAIILKNFSDRQIKIEKKIINFIISRIDRSYRKIDEFIYKIDELSLKKKKPINLKTIKEIL
ncbi:DNA replication protein [Pelagibacterales bacterium SAG-MED23]|nr:DNA replication protein [Pelagibacterales bacterium SAG-MED23]